MKQSYMEIAAEYLTEDLGHENGKTLEYIANIGEALVLCEGDDGERFALWIVGDEISRRLHHRKRVQQRSEQARSVIAEMLTFWRYSLY